MSWAWKPRGVAVLCLLGLAAGCDPNTPPPQEGENLLVPRQWMQIQSDEQGTGFNGVHTVPAAPIYRKWAADVGELATSSPVVDNDGDVWVGNINGELVEVSPNGVVKTRKQVGGRIVSSPAVDDHYRVYVLAQYPDGDTFRTLLHCWDPALGFVALNNPPHYRSTASPKVWQDYVFVPSDRTLRVFDRWTLSLVAEKTGCPTIACGDGPSLDDLLGGLGSVVGCILDLATLYLVDLADCGTDFTPGMLPRPSVDPSVAVVDNATIVDDVNKPIVIMATSQCLTAFDFDPTADNKLKIRWQQELVEIDCDFKFLHVTTPAVLDGDQVVIGDDEGHVRSFYVDDGSPLWTYTSPFSGVGRPIVSPPVAALRQIYVLTGSTLIVLDSDGAEITRTPLKGSPGGLSLSLDYVYAMTSEGLYSSAFNGSALIGSIFDDAVFDGTYFGATTPAIDRDGNIYLATPNGYLYAYGRNTRTLSAIAPAVSWIAPSDGASVYTSAGQTMQVALNADGGFTGNVTITSDVDGILCEFEAMGATEGSCMTTGPLTLGPHVLTAFATDPDGVQESAQIGVEVVAAPIQ